MSIYSKDDEDLRENVEEEFMENHYIKYNSKAIEYVNNKDKARDLLKRAMDKAKKVSKKGPISEMWDKIVLLFSLLRDWINGAYKEIPVQSITAIMIGLIYFVVPLDIMPDFIPGIGIVDDAFVLGLIIKQMNNDLEDYKIWKKSLDEEVEIDIE